MSARHDMTLGPMHCLANMLDHRYLGNNLSDDQKSCVYEYLANSDNTHHAELIPFVVAVQHGETFPQYLFKDSFKSVTPMTWWKEAAKNIRIPLREQMIDLCCQLFSAVASTAALERIFSSFGLGHSKLRNRLGNEKAAKLTFCFGH
jgi:hAT family C-terminal dimerisation region